MMLTAGFSPPPFSAASARTVDQADEGLPVKRETPLVEIVVAEDPQRPQGILGGAQKVQRHRRVDDDLVHRFYVLAGF